MDDNRLLTFFKALADANRLKIVGLLAQRGHSVEELAALLDLKPPTVTHHLSRLAKAGLVSARSEGYYNIYQLDKAALEAAARNVFSVERISTTLENVDLEAYDRKVLADFSLPDGSLREIPAQRRKLEVILRHIALSFESDVKYSEKQVNQILKRFHADSATLRRELVGFGLMQRSSAGRVYWVNKV